MSIKISEYDYMNTNATLTEESKKEKSPSAAVKKKARGTYTNGSFVFASAEYAATDSSSFRC